MSVNPRISIDAINSVNVETTHFDGTRYYDPMIERFLGENPIGFASGDFNFYRYVYNNAVNYYDFMGLDGNSASIGDIICGIVTAPVTGATVLTEAGKNAQGLIAGGNAIKDKHERGKKFDQCKKDKKKSDLECALDYYSK
jgi:RHS repeat-associated protein